MQKQNLDLFRLSYTEILAKGGQNYELACIDYTTSFLLKYSLNRPVQILILCKVSY